MNIALNLVKNKKANIHNNQDVLINTTSISDLLYFTNHDNVGCLRCVSDFKYKLTEIALCLKNHFKK